MIVLHVQSCYLRGLPFKHRLINAQHVVRNVVHLVRAFLNKLQDSTVMEKCCTENSKYSSTVLSVKL